MIMKKLVFCAIFTLGIKVLAAAAVTGTVNVDDFLNVRTGPSRTHKVTGRLRKNEQVKILRVIGSWLEIEAPQSLPVYVAELGIRNGVLRRGLNMRARKDSASHSYGELPAGTKVTLTDERANGWVRILPPAGIKVYVAAICVSYDRNAFNENGLPAGAVETKPAEKPVEKPVETEPAKKPAEKPVEKPVEIKPAEVKTAPQNDNTLTGILIKWKFSEQPETRYALLDKPDGKNQAFIILAPGVSRDALTGAENKKVKVEGSFISEIDPAKAAIPLFSATKITVL